MERYLDPIETGIRSPAVLVLAYRGNLDIESLALAFKELCTSYPILCGRITRDDHGYRLAVHPDVEPDFSVITQGWQGITHGWCNVRWNDMAEELRTILSTEDETQTKVSRLIVDSDAPIGGYVVFAIEHAAIAAQNAMYYISELWNLYTDIKSGNMPSCGNRGNIAAKLPRPPTEILRERWPRSEGAYKDTDGFDIGSPPHNLEKPHALTSEVTLDRDETTLLIDRAQSMGASVNTVLLGETTLALAEYEPSESRFAQVGCSVSLYDRISPPVAIDETTFLMGQFIDKIPTDADPVSIGRHFKKRLNASINNNSILIAGYTHPWKSVPIYVDDIWWN